MISPALKNVIDARVPLAPPEAVAVVQQVIYNRIVAGEEIDQRAVASLFDRLLPPDAQMPAALRFTIARARGDVEAPPFESPEALMRALKRFERGDRVTVVREVLARLPQPRRPRRRIAPITAALAIAASALIGTGVGLQFRSRPVEMPAQAPTAPPIATRAEPLPVETLPGDVPRATKGTADRRDVATDRRRAATDRPERAPQVVRAVATDTEQEFSPAFATDGTAMFFHTGHAASEPSAIKEANRIDGDLRVMTIVDDGARNYHVQPSPDGSRIAFDSDRDGERAIYVANGDGTNVRRITSGPYAAVPTWSPDGTRLAFVRAEPDRPRVWNLWIVSLADGAMRRLTSFRFGQTWGASWFPDGRRIAYTHETRLSVLNLDTGAERDYDTPVPRRLVRTAAVSPAGTHVIFQVTGSGAWLLDLRDDTMRCVLTDATAEEFAWSPDGRRVAFHSRRDGQWGIWIMAPS